MSYIWNAKDYAISSSAQQIWAQELMSQIALQGHESILDIGCGDGKNTAELARRVPQGQVIGIDLSADMIGLAQSCYPKPAYPNLHFEVQDACHLPYSQMFDIIFSNATLHWILDHQLVLQSIGKALKLLGKAWLQMGGQGNAAALLEVVNEIIQEKIWAPYFENFTFPWAFFHNQEYRTWIETAGLNALRVELKAKDMVQKDLESFKAWLRTTWLPYISCIPQQQQARFIHALVACFVARHPLDEKGCVHLGMVRLEVELQKPLV